MWKLKVAQGNDPYLFSTNNFVGRQIWEYDPSAAPAERQEVEDARQQFTNSRREGVHACGDLLMRMQLIKENGIDVLSIPPVRLGENEDVNYDAVTTTVKKVLRLNRAIQAKDGHWPAENAGPMLFTPPLLIAMYISGTINTHLTTEHKTEMIRYIYNHQNEDGGFRLLGEGPDDGNGVVDQARKWILDHGGAASIPSWGKTYLSVLGVYEREGCNPLPPEFWLFPEALPYHPEIHPIPYDEINWNKQRHICCKEDLYYPHSTVQDFLWDGLHYLSEPILKYWPFAKLRKRGLKRALELMRYGVEESRYITIGCVSKSLQMMCWWAENPNGDEFKHHLARVPDYLWLAEDGMKMQSFGSQLWDFVLATQAIIASDMCLLLLSQMPEEISGEKADNERLYEAVNVLLYSQSPISGGFAIWEPPVPQPYLQMLNPSELFADIVVEKEEKEIEISVAKAVCFLEGKQWHDGSWYGYWGICFLYGTFFALAGLVSAGKRYDNSEAVHKAVNFLLAIQNEEGGWGESFESCPSEVYTPLDGNRTNLVQTSWAMLGLMFGGQVERDPTPLHKAAKILIKAQMDNGDFPQQEITGVYMKNCMQHYAGYRNIFPLWALGEYRKRVWVKTKLSQ
ncbi:dammarenediol II synthase-like protein [Tanacetum coccineum]